MKRDGEHRGQGGGAAAAVRRPSWWKRAAQASVAAMVAGVALGGAGCLSRPINPLQPTTSTTEVETLHQSKVDKIDLLLMIDNSASMADKQAILADAVTNLVTGLLNPKCLDQATMKNEQVPPALTPTENCLAGYSREFNPVFDVHIGIVSSSLGGHGEDNSCEDTSISPNGNDHGHLLNRGSSGTVSTYLNKGFLAWDPNTQLKPPGIGDLATLSSTLADLVAGTGQSGCGYEASLESWYRFLVDPKPYTSITMASGKAVQSGRDDALLQQRADFMRPDSLLAIIMLSDENDCSIKEYSYYPIVGNSAENFQLPAPSKQCATDPTSSCCTSCQFLKAGDECYDASGCAQKSTLTVEEDPSNLRCFHNKQRFGIDFLYPIERYTIALTQPRIPDPHVGDGTDSNAAQVENPIFSDLNKTGDPIRDKSLVFIAGIVGVPWQDISVSPGDLSGGFKDDVQMNAATIDVNGSKKTTWQVILGDPDNFVDPDDPHMIESQKPRSGTDPINNVKLQPPTAAVGADSLNGHEWDTAENANGDLQYACVFELPGAGKDCSTATDCDCPEDGRATTNPLCDPANTSQQVRAKGYPGIRELQVIKSAGPQGIVGSICPASLADSDRGKIVYGYNAAVQGIINRLKAKLGGACLAETFRPFTTGDEKGQVPCVIIEASKPASCDAQCNQDGHRKVKPENEQAITSIKEQDEQNNLDYDCFCELIQADNNSAAKDLDACLNSPENSPPDIDRWCYVDAEVETVDPTLVKDCPTGRKRRVRFLGGTNQQSGTVYVTCSQ